MSGRRRTPSVSVGHDAFLDIVANLVGILIILVVVLGAQSQEVIRHVRQQIDPPIEKVEEPVDPKQMDASEDDFAALANTAARAAAAQADSDRLEKNIEVFDKKIDQQSERRTILLTLLSEAESAWENEQSKLSKDQQVAAMREAEAAALEKQLKELKGESEQLKGAEPAVVAISHLPTPMAKTVFGKEVHFRLKDNRLSVVPIDSLTEEIGRDMRRMASGSREGMMDAAIGPVRGYVARYVLNRSNEMVNQGNSIRQMSRFQVMAAAFEPLSEPYGMQVDQVLANDNWLDVELAGKSPGGTTVTVWVYPDSYGSFRKLKEKLYAKGYATAARPLNQDRPIIASAAGSRSTAQ